MIRWFVLQSTPRVTRGRIAALRAQSCNSGICSYHRERDEMLRTYSQVSLTLLRPAGFSSPERQRFDNQSERGILG